MSLKEDLGFENISTSKYMNTNFGRTGKRLINQSYLKNKVDIMVCCEMSFLCTFVNDIHVQCFNVL